MELKQAIQKSMEGNKGESGDVEKTTKCDAPTSGHSNGTNGHTNGHTNGTNGHTNG